MNSHRLGLYEYGPPPESLPARLVGDHEDLVKRGCMVMREEDIKFAGRMATSAILDNGRFTIVHSTDHRAATSAMDGGLYFDSHPKGALEYHASFARLYSSGADISEADRHWWNTFALGYRYAINRNHTQDLTSHRGSKVVIQFPFPSSEVPPLGESWAYNTPIESRNRRFVTRTKERYQQCIKPEFVLGVLRLDTGDFDRNPKFNDVARRGLAKFLR